MKNPYRDKLLASLRNSPSHYEEQLRRELKHTEARADDLRQALHMTARNRLIIQIERQQQEAM